MAIRGGVACCTSASESVVSVVARTIPLAPFLGGRGKKLKLSGGHPQTPGSGATPRCTPCSYVPSLRGACNVAIRGGVAGCTSASESVVSVVARTIPLAPFLGGRGKKLKLSGGHPQTPGSGATPRCTPCSYVPSLRGACNVAIRGGVAGCTSASESVVSVVARTIPLAPFLGGRGKKLKLSGGHPQTPGSGATPLCTPCSHVPSLVVGACNVAIRGGYRPLLEECPLPLDVPPPQSHLY